MEKIVKFYDWNPEIGMRFNWEYGFTIKVEIKNNIVNITANEAGLVSLANHLLNLAQIGIPSKYHFHLDDSNALEKGSDELIIEKDLNI